MQDSLSTSLTGATLSDVPIMTSKSTLSRSSSKHLSKSNDNAWPKNVMSGYRWVSLNPEARWRRLAFMMPGSPPPHSS